MRDSEIGDTARVYPALTETFCLLRVCEVKDARHAIARLSMPFYVTVPIDGRNLVMFAPQRPEGILRRW